MQILVCLYDGLLDTVTFSPPPTLLHFEVKSKRQCTVQGYTLLLMDAHEDSAELARLILQEAIPDCVAPDSCRPSRFPLGAPQLRDCLHCQHFCKGEVVCPRSRISASGARLRSVDAGHHRGQRRRHLESPSDRSALPDLTVHTCPEYQHEKSHTARRCLIAVTTSGSAASASNDEPATKRAAEPLFDKISALDTAVFDAFNSCSSPAQLRKHASYFAPNVEFYHDTGGVTWSRQEMLTNTEKNACGHFRREIVPGTLRVFPIKDFGAIELGSHRFCQLASGKCEGIADFVMVWSNQNGSWQITRVLSYGHRPNK